MKVFDKLDMKKMKESWQNRFNPELSYYGGKDIAFTPAIQAQVSPVSSKSIGEMPAYSCIYNVYVAQEFTGWFDECNAIANTCYIGDWSWLVKKRLSGPDAVKCMEACTINSYDYPVGKARHIISITPDGKMIGDGIAFREGENEFLLTSGSVLENMIRPAGFDVTLQDVTVSLYNFHVQGPNSRKVIEKLCGENIGDLKFVHFRNITVCGRKVMLFRGGMSGELGYEFLGASEDGSVIWQAVVDAGKEFEIRQLGFRSLMLNHLQAFFPTTYVDYIPSFEANAEALYRSPVDYGWGYLIDKNRNFPGKDILLDELAHPQHKTMMLEWNSDDCISIYSSLFDKNNDTFEQMSLPVSTSEQTSGAPYGLPVFNKDNQMIGFATNRGYSIQFKTVISITHLDIRYTIPGTEVFVLYGRQGKRQMLVRAKVAEAPYKKDNRK